ncbi:MAG: p-hydroxybenzoate 3-monooxygenase, partial [Solirubrobacteraceae bacterium]|nr:p-hydroxybenzoate 3-monooxygenase [Solirubrobacteraceae bacterium]
TIYGQTEVTKDLIAHRLSSQAPLRFECRDVGLSELDGSAPVVTYRHRGRDHELCSDFIAGCDGYHGVCRESIPAGRRRSWQREYPFAWLGILAEVAPSTDELIYARHERGFALHSMRSPDISRLYIQVGPEEEIHDWPDGRVWEELDARLATGGWSLTDGPVLEKSITPMRSFVAAPMRYGRLFLAGDAAHIVPPTGAKGLNLAVSDVTVLADALVAHFAWESRTGLDEYSDRCLARVWRAQQFAAWMTQLLHVDPGGDDYGRQLQLAELRYVTRSRAAARSLAENYVGLPLERTAIAEPTRG